jgi:transcriptional regulator with XRE-family HTH domain
MTGDELRRRRDRMGLSQSQLGALLGVDRFQISKWERRHGEPITTNLVRVIELAVCEVERQVKAALQ